MALDRLLLALAVLVVLLLAGFAIAWTLLGRNSSSAAVNRLAPVVDAGRARLRAIGERRKQIGQLRVAVLLYEPGHADSAHAGRKGHTRATGSVPKRQTG